jgi:hypothetical protein
MDILITDGSHAGCMEHQDNVVSLSTDFYNPISSDDGKEHGPTALNEDAVELCQYSRYAGQNILIEDAIETVDGWVHEDETMIHDESEYQELPVLNSRRRYYDMVRTHAGEWVCTQSDYVHHGYVDRYGNEDYFYDTHDEYYSDNNGNYYMSMDVVHGMGMETDSDGYVCQPQKYRADYGHFSDVDKSDGAVCTFGIEVEKEDEDAMESATAQALYDSYGWAKERDGSLCSDKGFEFVSPIYSLTDLKKFKEDIAVPIIKQHLDADYDRDSCGGHITVSHKDYTSDELFEGMTGSFPLIYALYPFRTSQSYCQAKSKREMGYSPTKYSSFYQKNSRLLEFRIFPAFRSADNALWRIELIQILIKNINKSESEWLSMIVNRKSIIHRHLAKMYAKHGKSPDTGIMDLVSRFVKYSKVYNHVNLNAQYARIVKIVEHRNKKAA